MPDADESVLWDELRVVIQLNALKLGRNPSWERRIRHLLATTDAPEYESYERRAGRLCDGLAAALSANAAENDDIEADATHLLTDEQHTGMRILYGLDSRYLDKGPTYRRENAAEYLAPDWVRKREQDGAIPPGDPRRAKAFRDGPEGAVLSLTIQCLRATFDQPGAADEPWVVLNKERHYEVDAHRDIVRQYCQTTIRSRVTGLDHCDISEVARELPDANIDHYEFQPVAVEGFTKPSTSEEVQGNETTAYRLSFPPLSVGDTYSYAWEETFRYLESGSWWKSFHVADASNTDGAPLRFEVRFQGEAPSRVWWFSEKGGVKIKRERPHSDRLIVPDENDDKLFVWEGRTSRAYDVGVAWQWLA